MFDPDVVLSSLWVTFRNDAQTLALLDLTGKPVLEIAKRILKRSSYDGLTGSERRLNLYFRPSRRGRNDLITNEILQFDCHVPATLDYIAYRMQKRVRELLHEQQIGSQIFHFDGQLGELPSMTGFFCAGSRYVFHNVI